MSNSGHKPFFIKQMIWLESIANDNAKLTQSVLELFTSAIFKQFLRIDMNAGDVIWCIFQEGSCKVDLLECGEVGFALINLVRPIRAICLQ
jgi:hypothetical protein